MNTPEPSHELFEEMQREHEELRALLGNLHKVLAERLDKVQRVAELLASLVDHVETHFEEEEVAGFFDQIVDRAPRLSDNIERLRHEHQQLLGAVRQLNQVASQGNGSADWWQQLEQAFHQFSTELMHHESAENDLLQQAFTDDIGTGD